jgi:hypothetical protein
MQSRPNIICIEAGVVSIEETMDGGLREGGLAQNGIVIRFTNERIKDASGVEAPVRAVLRYHNGEIEYGPALGCWLDHHGDVASFQVDGTHKLIAGIVVNGKLVAITKRDILTTLNEAFPIETVPLDGFQTGTLTVSLTDADTGDSLYEGEFAVTVKPLSIFPE